MRVNDKTEELHELETIMLNAGALEKMEMNAGDAITSGLEMRTIMMVVLDSHLVNTMYWARIVDTVEAEVKRLGMKFKMCIVNLKELVTMSPDPDGYILLGDIPSFYIDQIVGYHKPVVLIDCSSQIAGVDHVRANNHLGAYRLTQLIINAGHQRLAFYSDNSMLSFRQRYQGFEECVMDNAAQGVTAELVTFNNNAFTPETIVELLSRKNRPTAIFACNDTAALALYKVSKQIMLKIPDDLSIIGFDNIREAKMVQPQLTTATVPRMDMAITAVKLIVKKMLNPHCSNTTLLLETQPMIRGSLTPPKIQF